MENINYVGSNINIARHIAYLCDKHEAEQQTSQYRYNNTKIQKLLYICYGIFLIWFPNGEKLVEDRPRIWPYGVVFPKVFMYLKSTKDHYALKFEKLETDYADALNAIVKTFGVYSAGKLSAWSHKADSPWAEVVNNEGENWNTPIPDELIKNHFKKTLLKHYY